MIQSRHCRISDLNKKLMNETCRNHKENTFLADVFCFSFLPFIKKKKPQNSPARGIYFEDSQQLEDARRIYKISLFSCSFSLSFKSRAKVHTGCSLNVVFLSEDYKIFLSLFPHGISVCTQQNWQSLEKSQNFKEKKHNIY